MSPVSLDAAALALFEAALDFEDPGERERFVHERSAGDWGLRAKVLRMLARDADPAGGLSTLFLAEQLEAPVTRIPERLGPYRVVAPIADGGMGTVLRAERDDGVFQQVVAIKLIRTEIAGSGARKRFDEERRILAQLRHPAIVRILDGGEQEGHPWLAMDFVEGEPITTALQRPGTTTATRLAALQDVCEAVSYAHRNLVVHADLKPSNVVMAPDGSVHLLDFGIARLLSRIDGDAKPAFYPMTPAYAAPERASGSPPTIASDVYGLGVLLHEVLTGELPLDGRVTIPNADLAAICRRAIAASPAKRYPDVATLLGDLARHRQHAPLVARAEEGWRYATACFIRRHRAGLLLTAFAMIALAAATVVSTRLTLRAEQASREARARFDEVRSLAHFMLFDLYDQLSREPGTVGTRVEIARMSARYLEQLRSVPNAPLDLQLEVGAGLRRLAAVQGVSGTSSLGQVGQASATLRQAEAQLQTVLALQPRNVDALVQLGNVYADLWTLEANSARSTSINATARRYFDEALALAPHRIDAQLGRIGTDKNEAYDLIKGTDQSQQARQLLEGALARLHALDVPAGAEETARALEYQLLSKLGDATYYGGDTLGSLVHYQHALAVVDEALRADGESPAWLSSRGEALWNISGVIEEIPSRRVEALADVEAGIAVLKRVLNFGPDANAEKKLAILYSQQGMLLSDLGRQREAIAPLENSIAIRTSRLQAEPNDPTRQRDLAIGQMSFADVLAQGGQMERACEVARAADAVWAGIETRGNLTDHDRKTNRAHATEAQRLYCR